MLETGVQAKILIAISLEGNNAVDLARKINTWIASSNRAVIHDIQYIKIDTKVSAIILYRE